MYQSRQAYQPINFTQNTKVKVLTHTFVRDVICMNFTQKYVLQ